VTKINEELNVKPLEAKIRDTPINGSEAHLRDGSVLSSEDLNVIKTRYSGVLGWDDMLTNLRERKAEVEADLTLAPESRAEFIAGIDVAMGRIGRLSGYESQYSESLQKYAGNGAKNGNGNGNHG
jgi:hypothetical protein